MRQIFIGSKLKIERANKHIADFDTLASRFVKSEFYRTRIEKDAQTGDDIRKIEVTAWLPPVAVLVIGDAIHNLHSALDLMI